MEMGGEEPSLKPYLDDLETPQSSSSSLDKKEIFRAMEIVERDSAAIAESFASLFSSLRLALSEVTSNSVENMECFNDIVGSIQESALDAATKGNRYINSCLRLNEELKSIESLSMQLLFSLPSMIVSDALWMDMGVAYDPPKHKDKRENIGKILRKNVDTLDCAVDKLLRFP